MDYRKIIDELIEDGEKVLSTMYEDFDIEPPAMFVDSTMFTTWATRITNFLNTHFDDDIKLEYLKPLKDGYSGYRTWKVKREIELLKTLIKQVDNKEVMPKMNNTSVDAASILIIIFNKFHRVARQLRTRHDGRKTIEINDEYDVQDLLHAILLIHFEDIRDEEWTPSYAGASSRTDFLLKNEKIIIEVKKTRPKMTAKVLGEELIIDIEKYKEHPDCEKLLCFVYDPEGHLGNPTAIMNDLNKRHEGFAQVVIRPEM